MLFGRPNARAEYFSYFIMYIVNQSFRFKPNLNSDRYLFDKFFPLKISILHLFQFYLMLQKILPH